jgi:hypothetical protein
MLLRPYPTLAPEARASAGYVTGTMLVLDGVRRSQVRALQGRSSRMSGSDDIDQTVLHGQGHALAGRNQVHTCAAHSGVERVEHVVVVPGVVVETDEPAGTH